MVNWFRRKPRDGRVLALRSRGESDGATRVDFAELAPAVDTYLGQAAYLQLGYFETLSQLITATPELQEKAALSRAAGAALTKHEALVGLIRDRGGDPTAVMLPFREQLDAFRRTTHGDRINETLLTVHLTAGLLDDFYTALASSYGDTGRRAAKILGQDADRDVIVDLVAAAIESDEEWRSLLSLWGRRLVGDTLLVARDALNTADQLDQAAEAKVEPVFTELMSAHARRMDAMGLNA